MREGDPVEHTPASRADEGARTPAGSVCGRDRAGGAPRYRTVLLDLDGTLVDSLRDLADAGNFACRQMGWPTHRLPEYRRMVGNGQRVLARRIAPEGLRGDADAVERAYLLFCERYAAHRTDHTAPYPGIPQALARMRRAGVRLGVLTNKNEEFARDLVRLMLADAVDLVAGRTDAVPAKPDPAMGRALMGALGASPASTLMVGDSDVDIACGRSLGVDACGVLWGFRDRQELLAAGATHLAPTPEALADLVVGA